MKFIHFLFVIFIVVFSCTSERSMVKSDQFMQEELNAMQVMSINRGDTLIKFQLVGIDPGIKTSNQVNYSWFRANQIYSTQGGYSGTLLNGQFEMHIGNQLREKGRYRYGTKHGTWKYWFRNGNLRSVNTYDMGVESGSYELFRLDGKMIEAGSLRSGIRHGNITFHLPEQDSTFIIKFQKGIPKDTLANTFWR